MAGKEDEKLLKCTALKYILTKCVYYIFVQSNRVTIILFCFPCRLSDFQCHFPRAATIDVMLRLNNSSA